MNEILTVSDQRLDEMFSHEAGCEANHNNPLSSACSGGVTSRCITTCGVDKLICAAATGYVVHEMSTRHRCESCQTPVSDCWSVTPA